MKRWSKLDVVNDHHHNFEGRATCYLCLRPESHCVCKLVEPFFAHCNFLILQHPHERKKYYSTTKIVARAIRNTRLIRGVQFEQSVLEQAIAGQKAYLLYPSDTAIHCDEVPLDESTTVIVLDGTWSEAGKILRRNQILRTLPALTFKQKIRSQYRIRKQPRDHCLSTLECIGHLLKLNAAAYLEPHRGVTYDTLFDGFEKMVQQQLHFFPRMRGGESEEMIERTISERARYQGLPIKA